MIAGAEKEKKQFDYSHMQIDEKLQGSQLASFPRRALAYGIDWLIIILSTKFFVLLLPLAAVFLLFKKKLRHTLVLSRRMLRKNVHYADQKLEKLEVDQKLRQQFRRHMTVYLYVLIYLPLIISGLALTALVLSIFSVETYDATKASVVQNLSGIFRPINDMNDAMGLLASFFGAFLYFTFFTWQWQGSTPGKRIASIKVVKLNGKPLSFWGSLERATGYTASASLLGFGFFQYFWDRNCQTTHDKITETIVVEI